MSIIQQIIEAILSIFGMGSKKPEPTRTLTAADKDKIKSQAVKGLEDVEGEENIKVFGTGDDARIVESRDGADLVEEDGELQWVQRVDDDVPVAEWVDEWGPLKGKGPTTLEDFCFHEMVFDHTRASDPRLAEQKLQKLGYVDAGHWYKVRTTVVKHYAQRSGPNVGDGVFSTQEYLNAGLKAAARKNQMDQQATADANPELLAPVEGVTVEQYAGISARLAQGLDQAGLLALLAQSGLDLATWEKASAGWMDKMSKDTTATIASIYGKAFMGSGQGQFGGTAQQVAEHAYTGTAAGGAEPIPFEKVCEIQGAMSAWAKSGQDVNALLQSTFGMKAMDFSAAQTWWLTQLMADFPRFEVYNKKVEEWEQKYSGGMAKAGSDVDF